MTFPQCAYVLLTNFKVCPSGVTGSSQHDPNAALCQQPQRRQRVSLPT